ncbi:hypothetical protein ACFL35_08870 [Candidatus Riflebacteria bacterium]
MFVRKKYLIDKDMQGKFVFTVLSLIFLVTIISVCNLVVLTNFFVNQQAISFQKTTTIQVLVSAIKVLWPRLLLLLIINVVIVCIVCIFYSHQIAGPAFNLTRVCKELAKGNLYVSVTLRKNDHLQGIAENINQMTRNIQTALVKIKENSEKIQENTSKFRGGKIDSEKEFADVLENIKSLNTDSMDQLAAFKLVRDETSTDEETEEVEGEIQKTTADEKVVEKDDDGGVAETENSETGEETSKKPSEDEKPEEKS